MSAQRMLLPNESPTMTSDAKRACASCGVPAHAVERTTLLHQLKHPHPLTLPDKPFYFCAQPHCGVVYFSADGTVYRQEQLRQPVGQKSVASERVLCYCFDITEAVVRGEWEETGHSASQAFVVAQTQAKRCACAARNPAGGCCLKDFQTVIKTMAGKNAS